MQVNAGRYCEKNTDEKIVKTTRIQNSNLPTGLQTLNFSQQCRSQMLLNTVTLIAFRSTDALYNQIGWVTEVKVTIEEKQVKIKFKRVKLKRKQRYRQWTLLAITQNSYYHKTLLGNE